MHPKDYASRTTSGFESQKFVSEVPPFPFPGPQGPPNPPPTLQYLTFYTPSGAGWIYLNGNVYVMNFQDPLLIFSYDPSYPQFNPALVTLSASLITGSDVNQTGRHYWQTDQSPNLPEVRLTVMGKSGYQIGSQIVLGSLSCSPYEQPLRLPAGFDASQWANIDYCTIDVGNQSSMYYWMNLD